MWYHVLKIVSKVFNKTSEDKLPDKYARQYNLKWSNFDVKKVQIYMENDRNDNGYGFVTCKKPYQVKTTQIK